MKARQKYLKYIIKREFLDILRRFERVKIQESCRVRGQKGSTLFPYRLWGSQSIICILS